MTRRTSTLMVALLLLVPSVVSAGPFEQAMKIVENPSTLARQAAKAEALFRQAVAAKPGHADAWYNLGMLALRRQDLPAAKRAWQQALAVKPTYIAAKSRLAILRLQGPERATAIAELDAIVKKHRFQPEARNALAQVAIEEKKWAAADVHLRNVLLGDPNNLNAFVNLAVAQLRQDRVDQAYLIVFMGLEKHKNSPALHNILGLIFLKKDNSQRATKHFLHALKVDPNQIDALLNLASLELAYGDFQTALKRFERVLKRQPKNAMVVLSRAVALRGLGKYKAAEAGYKRAMELDPKLTQARYNLCVLYYQFTSEYTKAQQACTAYFKTLTRKHPKYRELKKRLKSIKSLIKDEEEERRERARKKTCRPACKAGETCDTTTGSCMPNPPKPAPKPVKPTAKPAPKPAAPTAKPAPKACKPACKAGETCDTATGTCKAKKP